ncbi:EF-hand domain-containing protein [Phyllobacterium ifriqiyense]|uniref:EF-hand domain-containing protein n=1 Tax=Phyllobacterium ifriqiyense TaxID=314238 RepID=UPI003399FDA3
MKQRSHALIAVLVAGLSTPAFSAEAKTGSPVLLQQLDANNDSAVSRDEMLAARAKLFARLDFNGDGLIDQDEIEGFRDVIMDRAVAMQAFVGNQMRRLDTGGDGTVSPDEFRVRPVLFDLADRDGDGKLTGAEFLVLRNIISNR